ncbi:nose resistant to fluoxetine protein 6-like [Parasteatoda tepidariorum]|uniref:nose resistant to fluoxetine protein 6-like n=1 Tax=Parasteatoda tepidariorum TaxID=114398 RepID=UPI00077FDED1|nr:nose resistant to fluoxetine protein 6-like [Parasteatoda tepidariorum]
MKHLKGSSILICCAIFLFFVSVTQADDTVSNSVNNEKMSNLTVLDKWKMMETGAKELANKGVKALLSQLVTGEGRLNISSQCMREGMLLISGLKNIKPWAIRFIDSSAKIIDGALTGSMSSFGSYDECVDTIVRSEKSRDKGKMLFRGQYCSIDIRPPLPPVKNFYKLHDVLDELKNFSEGGTVISEAAKYAHFFYFLSLRMGICVPSGCSYDDISEITNSISSYLTLDVQTLRCEIKQVNEFTPIKIFTMFVYSFAGLFMLIGSSIDMYSYYTKTAFKGTGMRVLLSFSFISNFKKFVNTKSTSDTLSCLNGIRFLCMSWIILGHSYLNVNFQIFLGLEKVRAYAKDFAFQAVINASVAVDTFFCMGGLLVCYLTIKLVKIQGHPFNITVYILHRLWRILPVYTYVILFMFLGDLMGSGPIWYDTTHRYIKACEDNWWTNLIFVNNFYHAANMCIPQSWYMACDFQMYVAAILILIPILRWPRVGLSMCVVVIVSSILYCGIGTYVNNYPPTMLFAHPDPEQRIAYWADFYFQPFVHAGPYCIGMIAGYILATKPDLKLSRTVQVIGWSLAFISNFSVLYGVIDWNRGRDPYLWEGLMYASLNRVAWTYGVAWIIVCCATGHGGVINYILSWKAFVPLGRLTFIVYLIHPIVQIAVVGNVRTQIQPDHFFAVWIYFGHLCVTYGTAFAGSMLVESPLMSLEKIFLNRDSRKRDEEAPVRKNSVLNGTLKTEKNGDIASIVPIDSEDSMGVDNAAIVYRL